MSRYTITVTRAGQSDPDAVIGYDPPLETFFLQAFPNESGDDLALWLGTDHRAFRTLEALHQAAHARGYAFLPLPPDVYDRLLVDIAAEPERPEAEGPLGDFIRHLRNLD